MVRIMDSIYTFPITLPGNPLRWLNCYVIKAAPGGRNLLIDTGFHRPECLAELLKGMKELRLRPEETDVFFTHLHSDHTGNAADLQERGCRLLMSEIDAEVTRGFSWKALCRRMRNEGMPGDIVETVDSSNPGQRYISPPYTTEPLFEGDILNYGPYRLECLLTPGHSPGHMCLYDRERQLMFVGDHVLFDITPNITTWPDMEDALGTYLESLRKVMDLPVSFALPGHRRFGSVTLRERAEQLLAHHARRLAEAEEIARRNPGICAYDIAGQMRWKIRADSWDRFPPGQKWFAVGEALSHLDYLVLRDRITRTVLPDGTVVYS